MKLTNHPRTWLLRNELLFKFLPAYTLLFLLAINVLVHLGSDDPIFQLSPGPISLFWLFVLFSIVFKALVHGRLFKKKFQGYVHWLFKFYYLTSVSFLFLDIDSFTRKFLLLATYIFL